MADDIVKSEACSQQENEISFPEGSQQTSSFNSEGAPENQTLSKRQRKKLLKQQKWENERALRR